jgi:putative transposase
MRCVTINGSGFWTSCRAEEPFSLGRVATTGASSTRSCGWRALVGVGRWRDLPERFGDYQAVKRRDYRWIERGALDRFLDALANPVRLLLETGQRNDITKAHALIEGFEPEAIIADKGYDANHLLEAILGRGAEPVIPPKSNRRVPLAYDKALYKERNLVERFFNKLKQFRRVATRYDKLLANYRGVVLPAAIAIMLK